MAIQNRRGAYADFDSTKMVAGEFAVVQSGDTTSTDGKSVYIAFTQGNVKKLATADEVESAIENAQPTIEYDGTAKTVTLTIGGV